MKIRITLAALTAAFSLSAQAMCVGSGSFQSCMDDSGNSYDVTRMGGVTQVDGQNSRTGSRWSQTSQTIGNTTFHDGKAADGSSWNSTTQSLGNGTTMHSGTDSRGKSFTTICTSLGCF